MGSHKGRAHELKILDMPFDALAIFLSIIRSTEPGAPKRTSVRECKRYANRCISQSESTLQIVTSFRTNASEAVD